MKKEEKYPESVEELSKGSEGHRGKERRERG